MAWYGVAAGFGSIAGQVIGGALIAADFAGLGWRTIFLINVPFCLVIVAVAPRMLPGRGTATGSVWTRSARSGSPPPSRCCWCR